MILYIVRNGREERCGPITALSASATAEDLYHVSVRFLDGEISAYLRVENWRLSTW